MHEANALTKRKVEYVLLLVTFLPSAASSRPPSSSALRCQLDYYVRHGQQRLQHLSGADGASEGADLHGLLQLKSFHRPRLHSLRDAVLPERRNLRLRTLKARHNRCLNHKHPQRAETTTRFRIQETSQVVHSVSRLNTNAITSLASRPNHLRFSLQKSLLLDHQFTVYEEKIICQRKLSSFK